MKTKYSRMDLKYNLWETAFKMFWSDMTISLQIFHKLSFINFTLSIPDYFVSNTVSFDIISRLLWSVSGGRTVGSNIHLYLFSLCL